jgi:hypothetical protein
MLQAKRQIGASLRRDRIEEDQAESRYRRHSGGKRETAHRHTF